MDNQHVLKGPIFSSLIRLALPIMGTSFLQMTYHLVDMFWIGILGSGPVAAIGVSGYFVMFSMALVRLVQVGTEVNVAQSIGAEKTAAAASYAQNALILGGVIGLGYGLMLAIFNRQLIGFFQIAERAVEADAENYLFLMALGMIFLFLNPVITCLYNASGASRIPFRINAIGLLANMLLDPLFIFGLDMGVRGAALATVISQMTVTLILLRLLRKRKPFPSFHFNRTWSGEMMKDILHLGTPVAMQTGLFAVFSILLARIVASFGPDALAAQKVGVQIESISYMTAHGFSIALSAFTGQNHGAGNHARVRQGVITAGLSMGVFGLLTSFFLFYFAEPLFRIFIRDPEAVVIGTQYIKILALSQLFMCFEITFSGGFNGLRRTGTPAFIGIVFTGLRVPVAYIFSAESLLGLDGVWWTITGSSWVKGLLMIILTTRLLRHIQRRNQSTF